MKNEMTGMWGATDLNDLIRGLKMVLAQAEDVRAQGGTMADMKAIGTCGTCPKNSPILCNDYSDTCENCSDYGSYYCDVECDKNPSHEEEEEATLGDLMRLLYEKYEKENSHEEEEEEMCDDEDTLWCGKNCYDYLSDTCPLNENEPEPTDRILKDALAALDAVLAEYDKRNKR